jgi:hypothetical protein
MMFVLTEWNACKGGLFDMLCVVWVGQTCMIYQRIKPDALFCILTPLQKGDRSLVCCLFSMFWVGEWELSVLDLITPRYPTRGTEFLRIDFHRTNYGLHEPMLGAMWQYNEAVEPPFTPDKIHHSQDLDPRSPPLRQWDVGVDRDEMIHEVSFFYRFKMATNPIWRPIQYGAI